MSSLSKTKEIICDREWDKVLLCTEPESQRESQTEPEPDPEPESQIARESQRARERARENQREPETETFKYDTVLSQKVRIREKYEFLAIYSL